MTELFPLVGLFLFALGGWLGRRLGERDVVRRLSDALIDDGECGVHWMANEKSDKFALDYPCFCAAWGQIIKEVE